MSDLEMEQVRIQLSEKKEVVDALRNRKQMRRDKEGEYFPVVFNSQEVRFRSGEPKVFGGSVARCLLRSNYIILGDDLTGEMTHVLEPVDSYSLNDLVGNQKCDYCEKLFETPKRLAAHMAAEHSAELGVNADPPESNKPYDKPLAITPPAKSVETAASA